MTPEAFEEFKQRRIGKRVLICDKKHSWYGNTGEVKDFQIFSIINKMGMIISLDNGTDCTVFNEIQIQYL